MADIIDGMDDIIHADDIFKRFEELEADKEAIEEALDEKPNGLKEWEDADEFKALGKLIEDLKGGGGDEKWRGDWYPQMLIRDSHFEDYAQELAADCGMIDNDAKWPMNCIDWEQAARELKHDYSSIEVGGNDYWYR